MRPAKIILVIDAQAQRLAETRCLLHIHKFAVYSAITLDQVQPLRTMVLNNSTPDLMIGFAPGLDEAAFAARARAAQRPSLLVRSAKGSSEGLTDATLVDPSSERLLEWIKILSARKRGPRKGSHYKKEAADV